MELNTHNKIKEMHQALLIIKRLMPEVEAEISLMSGVGAAPGKKKLQKRDFLKAFHKNTRP